MKTKVLISCTVTTELICTFGFSYMQIAGFLMQWLISIISIALTLDTFDQNWPKHFEVLMPYICLEIMLYRSAHQENMSVQYIPP